MKCRRGEDTRALQRYVSIDVPRLPDVGTEVSGLHARTDRTLESDPARMIRISETLVLPAPAVASGGRDVVVTRDRAERPVHARTFSGAPLMGVRALNFCARAGDVSARSILIRKLAREAVLSIEVSRPHYGTFS